MTSVQFLNPENYNEAYWYCRLYLKTWEWTIDGDYQYRLNFMFKETATYVQLVYG